MIVLEGTLIILLGLFLVEKEGKKITKLLDLLFDATMNVEKVIYARSANIL